MKASCGMLTLPYSRLQLSASRRRHGAEAITELRISPAPRLAATPARAWTRRRSETKMDRRPPGLPAGPDEKPEPARNAETPPAGLSESEWDRILPPVDEDDPEWQAYARRKVQLALDDPRPPIPADEAFAQVYAHIAQRRSKRGICLSLVQQTNIASAPRFPCATSRQSLACCPIEGGEE